MTYMGKRSQSTKFSVTWMKWVILRSPLESQNYAGKARNEFNWPKDLDATEDDSLMKTS